MTEKGHSSPSVEILDIEDDVAIFRRFLSLKKNLTKKVVDGYCNTIKKFLYAHHGLVSESTVEEYLSRIKKRWKPKTYANYLGSFKRYVRDFKGLDVLDDYEFPTIVVKPIVIPTKDELRVFFDALPPTKRTGSNAWRTEPRYKALFLFLASSGLRLGEALDMLKRDVDT